MKTVNVKPSIDVMLTLRFDGIGIYGIWVDRGRTGFWTEIVQGGDSASPQVDAFYLDKLSPGSGDEVWIQANMQDDKVNPTGSVGFTATVEQDGKQVDAVAADPVATGSQPFVLVELRFLLAAKP